jgi:hypothetical protein
VDFELSTVVGPLFFRLLPHPDHFILSSTCAFHYSLNVHTVNVTRKTQKAGLIQLAIFDALLNVVPHLVPLAYLYYAMPDFPSTAIWKTCTTAAILFFDFTVVIIAVTLLNIDQRKSLNQEQVDNELFLYNELEGKK